MGFADNYLKKHQSFERLIAEEPATDLGIIVTIPCFNENEIVKALEGLYFCYRPKASVEIIVLINFPDVGSNELEKFHHDTYELLTKWSFQHNHANFKYFILLTKLPAKDAGVGYARKIAMDEAIHRFNYLNRSEGIIVGFDADCTVDSNYFVEIERLFSENPKANGCSIYFEHEVEGVDFPKEIYTAITKYELYLRYYIEALRMIGFPYAFHTIGSAFAVKASTYVKQGGMNKKKAGEDYYFLHKIIPLGYFHELNSTKVIPSPRPSNRVPFGTGKAVSKILQSPQLQYFTYSPKSFDELKLLFDLLPQFFKCNDKNVEIFILQLHPKLKGYLVEHNFLKKLEEINQNTSNLASFIQRFFSWFNGLMILHFLNESHTGVFEKVEIIDAATWILKKRGMNVNNANDRELLNIFRLMQHN